MTYVARAPYSIRIILTNKCNLHCDFCLANASEKDKINELDTWEWLDFFERLKELYIFDISFSGGEIFLRDDLFLLLNKLRENARHRISLLTNGTLITEEIAKHLKQINIRRIHISLDGLEKKHDELRGRGTFQRIVKGIQSLNYVGIKPSISFTAMRSNYMDLGPLIDFIASMGISAIQVNSLIPEGRCINIYNNLALKYPDQILEVLKVIENKQKEHKDFKIFSEIGFYYYLPQHYSYLQKSFKTGLRTKHLKGGCGAASTCCVITPNGNVIPCEGLSDFVGGNIREQDLLDIWNDSVELKKIRDLSRISLDQVLYCKDCQYNVICDGGCRALAYIKHNDLTAPNSLCPFLENIHFPLNE